VSGTAGTESRPAWSWRTLGLIGLIAVVVALSVGTVLITRAVPRGVVELVGSRHGGNADPITRVTLRGPHGDVTITPKQQPLQAAPEKSDLGTFEIAAGQYSNVVVRLGDRDLRGDTAVTVTRGGLTPILLGLDSTGLRVFSGSERVNLGLELLSVSRATLPATTFTDQNGKPVSSSSLRGKVTVIASFLTHCHESCPLFTQILADLAKVLQSRGLSDKVNLVEVTMDPGRDTPPVLNAYAQRTGATWPLLTAPDAQLRSFWDALYVNYATVPFEGTPPTDWYTGKPETYDVSHDTVAVILDQQGHPRFTLAGNPHLGHALSPALATFLAPSLVGPAAEQPGWTLADLLTRTELLLGVSSQSSAPNQSDRVQPGKPAPGFTLGDLAGRPVSLHDHLGQPVIVNFWATWCDPCRRELPLLDAAIGQHPGLVVLGVDQGESAETIRPFLTKVLGRDVAITTLRDPDHQVADRYAVPGLPVSVFIDPGGTVRAVHVGELDAPTLASELHSIGAG